MDIETKEFGTVAVDEKQIISFSKGIYGFESHSEWAILDAKRPFYVLQNLIEKEIAFVLINPYLFCPHYTLDISESDYVLINNPASHQLLIFAIVTIKEAIHDLTANLAGPLLINRVDHLGVQAIQQNTNWQTRYPLLAQNIHAS